MTKIECRRCLMTFEQWEERPPKVRRTGRSLKCSECGQPFRCRTKTEGKRVRVIPYIVGAPCRKFLVT